MPQKILIKRGLKENIPKLSVGELGYTTDSKELFIGSSGGNVIVSQPHINVKNIICDDGELVQGDGVHDDTTGILRAINTALSAGGTVFFPAGVYCVTSEIVVPDNIHLVGVGYDWEPHLSPSTNSVIKYDGELNTNIAVLRCSTAPIGVKPTIATRNVAIRNMVIDGNNKAGYGIYTAYTVADSVFTDISVIRAVEHGLSVNHSWYSSYTNIVASRNLGCGVSIGRNYEFGWNDNQTNGVYFANIRGHNNGSDMKYTEENQSWGYGVGVFNRQKGLILYNTIAEKNYGCGIYIDCSLSKELNIDGAYLEDNNLDFDLSWGIIVSTGSATLGCNISRVLLDGTNQEKGQCIKITGTPPSYRKTLVLKDISEGYRIVADHFRYILEGYFRPSVIDNIMGSKPEEIPPPTAIDCDELPTGKSWTSNTALNSPANNCVIETVIVNANTAVQMAYRTTSDNVYYRRKQSGVWQPWREITLM